MNELNRLELLSFLVSGHTIPAHTHPDANEWAYILSGEWVESDRTYTAGTLFFAPKGVRHGPHIARTEVISRSNVRPVESDRTLRALSGAKVLP